VVVLKLSTVPQARPSDAPDDAARLIDFAPKVEELTAEKEALKEQLDAMRGENKRLVEGAAGGAESGADKAEEGAKIAELEAALKHKEEVLISKHLKFINLGCRPCDSPCTEPELFAVVLSPPYHTAEYEGFVDPRTISTTFYAV